MLILARVRNSWFIVKRASDGKTAHFFGSDRFEQIAAFMGEVGVASKRGLVALLMFGYALT